jgi:hypothetical protein
MIKVSISMLEVIMVNFVITIAVVVVGVIYFSAPRKVEPVRLPVRVTKPRRRKH